MKKNIILWLLLCIGLYAESQVITVSDKETGQPVELVMITGANPALFVLTNIEGKADISSFQAEKVIELRALGYNTFTTSFLELQTMGMLVEMERSNFTYDKLVVSASRWKQKSRDIPSKVSIISPKDVALLNPQTAADLLGGSGEVFIQKSQQGGGSPMIRGFSTNRLLYSVDGIRMNTAIFRGGNLQNVISLDPFAMESTEILFGPGSVIYGSDAIGGVMSFQTLTPQLSATDQNLVTGKALSRYSSANSESTYHFDINLGWKKWALLTSVTSNDFGDLRMGGKGPNEYLNPYYVQRQDSVDVIVTNEDQRVQRPSAYSQINLMQKVRFRPNDKWDVQYGFHYSETSEYARYDRHIRYKDGLPRYGEWAYGPQVWRMNNLNITHSDTNRLYDQLTLRVAEQYFEESRISRNINKPDRERRIEEVQAYSANLDFTKGLGTKHRLFYGAEYVTNDVVSIGWNDDIDAGTTAVGASRYPQSTWSSAALYVTDQYNISDKFTLSAGLRYSQYKLDALFDTTFYPFPYTQAEINNASTTGSFGLVYKPTDNWTFSANASTGFRSPNVDDAGKVFDSEAGAVLVPNPDLEAEYAYNGEVGVSGIISDAVRLDLTGYYTVLENALVRREFQLNGLDSILYDGEWSGVLAIQNAAQATVYGLQAGIEIRMSDEFWFMSQINYQVGEEELDDGTKSPSRHAPPIFGVTRLTYQSNKLQYQFYATYSGERLYEDLPQEEQGKPEIYAIDKDGNPYSPSWYTLNFKAMYQIGSHFSVSAGVENLTDQRYRPYSSGIVAPGRNLVASLTAKF